MKTEIFRPISFWKSACLLMPDNSFFELMRSVFGKIKTPFNKQQLLDDLEKFLLREDIQKTIAAYIDETEAKIIKAIALFDEPVPKQLESFFLDELSYALLQDYIVNMEERFILYRFEEGCLALNPVLQQILLPIAKDTSVLFPAAENKKNSSAPASAEVISQKTKINDLTLASLYSFILKHETFFRPENIIRKKVIDESKKLFPGLDFKNTLGALQVLGLFYADEEKMLPDKKRFDDFAQLSTRERMEYCAAALIINASLTPPLDILPPLFRAKIRETVSFIHSFLNSLDTDDSYYPEKTILKILNILYTKTSLQIETSSLLDALEKTGLLCMENGAACPGMKFPAQVNDIKRSGGNKKAKHAAKVSAQPVIAFDSASSILVYPEIDFNDAVKLAFILNICETSSNGMAPVSRFELDKESAIRAFDNGMGADEIIELLKNLCGGNDKDINETFIWNLKDWEKRHGEVSLKKGIILRLSKEHQYLTDTRALSSLIDETLAPGVYFLNESAMDEAEEALRKAGVDIIAQRNSGNPPHSERKENMFYNYGVNYFTTPSSDTLPAININTLPKESADSQYNASGANELTANFHFLLDKMKLSETEKNELSARIDRRLVLCEAQLKDADIRYEKLEARHMDYAGKQNIAKQAISQKSPVHITWQFKNREKEMFGIPRTLEKQGNDLILVINDVNDELLRIPLAKISLLRRIKKSIFEK
jgi:hypothetical protein